MIGRDKFEYIDDIEATWEIIDRISRMVWERDEVSNDVKYQVNKTAEEFHSAMRRAGNKLPRREQIDRPSPPFGANVDHGQQTSGFRPFTVNKLAKMVVSKDVGSVAEAFLKATPVLEAMSSTQPYKKGGFVFRGQRNIEWKLVPSLARNSEFIEHIQSCKETEFIDGNRTQTSPYECDLIEEFKSGWNDNPEVEEIDRITEISSNDPSWWFRMQHYGDTGTRLLDVTSSIPAALLFACLDWESGEIDDTTDGVIYLFLEGSNANRVDFNESLSFSTDVDLFTGFPDAPVYFKNPTHNERSKAQQGSFLWWPRFWETLPGQLVYLRVPKENKPKIVQELLFLNYGPKDIVRGPKGHENEQSLRSSLGL